MDTIQNLFDFLKNSPSPFHAVQTAAARLEQAGYHRLEEQELWTLEPGEGYYLTRNESSAIAWRMPQGAVKGWRITASHSDSPTWRVKNDDVIQNGCCKLEVEGYGGMLMYSWLDRPLTVAGRAMVRTAEGVESRLVYFDRDLLVIPSLAIHMERGVNDGHKFNAQIDMQPLWGAAENRRLTDLVAEQVGVTTEDVLAADLVLAVRQQPTRIGPEGEYFLSPRIDDQECAATTLQAFLAAAPEAPAGLAPVWAMFDNEEVGSGSRQGAASSFLRDVLDRILLATGAPAQAAAMAMANSYLLSADNAHANHPNFPGKADPANPVMLGGGVVLKYNASQKYTTTALTGGIFREICRRADVKLQVFANRADLPGGSTLGNLQSHSLPIPMADIGLPQLAMHSAVETAAVQDAEAMVRAVGEFYRCPLHNAGDGRYTLG